MSRVQHKAHPYVAETLGITKAILRTVKSIQGLPRRNDATWGQPEVAHLQYLTLKERADLAAESDRWLAETPSGEDA